MSASALPPNQPDVDDEEIYEQPLKKRLPKLDMTLVWDKEVYDPAKKGDRRALDYVNARRMAAILFHSKDPEGSLVYYSTKIKEAGYAVSLSAQIDQFVLRHPHDPAVLILKKFKEILNA